MALRKRGDIYWIDITVPGSPRHRESTHTSDKGIAQAKHAEVERALRLGHALGTGKRAPAALGELFDRALRQHWRGTKGLGTVIQHRDAILRHIAPSTPVPAVAGAVPQLVEKLFAEGRQPATVNRTLQTLRKALHLAVDWGMLDRVPKLPRFAEPAGRKRIYSAEEERAILAFFDAYDPALARLTRILFATGWRLAEALRRDKIVLHPGAVQVWDTKTAGAGRTIPVSPATRALLDGWLGAAEDWNKDRVEYRWRKMREALGLGDEAVIHAIRHTVCTRLLRGGMSAPKVMLWMGHRDIQTTLTYTHLVTDDLAEGVSLVGG